MGGLRRLRVDSTCTACKIVLLRGGDGRRTRPSLWDSRVVNVPGRECGSEFVRTRNLRTWSLGRPPMQLASCATVLCSSNGILSLEDQIRRFGTYFGVCQRLPFSALMSLLW